MDTLTGALALTLVLLAVMTVLAGRLYRQNSRLRAEASKRVAKDLKLAEEPASERPRLVITLEILNPLELVAERSWIGGKVSALSPALMHRIVVKQTRDQLTAGMRENGVEVDARIVRIDQVSSCSGRE